MQLGPDPYEDSRRADDPIKGRILPGFPAGLFDLT